MGNKNVKLKVVFQIFLITFMAFSTVEISKAEEQKVCCAETLSGETCSYTEASNCDPNSQKAAASCEQTSFCKLGCGFDQLEGLCFNNMPKASCEDKENCEWKADPTCNIPQCNSGCCVLNNQCSFVTQTQCKAITSQYEDLDMTFDETVGNELECVNQCRSYERGACVHADASCEFTTREVCDEVVASGTNLTLPLIGFHPDMLCSNPKLGTECAAQQTTGCLPSEDEVYWFDSCGNIENIYSGDKARSYNGGYTLTKEQSCGSGSANINNPSCGNCDYSSGSICAYTEQGVSPDFGDYACKSLQCDVNIVTVDDNAPASKNLPIGNGESWCAYDGVIGANANAGFGLDLVGSRHYRRICINGVELTEACKDFREEICIQGEVDPSIDPALQEIYGTQESFGRSGDGNNLIYAACRDNRFETCTDQTTKKNCENNAQRDCIWLLGDTEEVGEITTENVGTSVACVPMIAPGLKHWSGEGSTISKIDPDATCEVADKECKVTYFRGGIGRLGDTVSGVSENLLGTSSGEWECVGNCQCLEKNYLESMNTVCRSLGDCGAWYNIEGKKNCDGFVENLDGNVESVTSDFEICDNLPEFTELKRISRSQGDKIEFWNANKASLIGLSLAGVWSWWTHGAMTYEAFTSGFMSGVSGLSYFDLGAGGNNYWMGNVAESFGTSTFVGESILKGPLPNPSGWSFTTGKSFSTIGIDKEAINVLSDKGVISISNNGEFANVISDASLDTADQAIVDAGFNKAYTGEGIKTFNAPDPGAISTEGIGSGIMQAVSVYMTVRLIAGLIDTFLSDEKTEVITIGCNPWQAPVGGDSCELCQEDGKDCSEYRCKSLGQNCKLVNEGSLDEKCISSDVNDVNPPYVTVNKEDIVWLTDSVDNINDITEIVGRGFEITQEIAPFTAVTLVVDTNEFAQCKYDVDHSMPYEEMTQYFGTSSYVKNHNLTFSLPGVLAEPQALQLTNGGEYQIYVKCQDGNGNANEADYYAKFSIQKGPDFTPPVIELTSIANGAYAPAGINATAFSVYVNEPSDCKWDDTNVAYEDMYNDFFCDDSILPTTSLYYGLYECTTVLTGIEDQRENKYYFRCKDQPNAQESDRNRNMESYEFSLKGTTELKITSVFPDDEELKFSSPVLKIVTSGGAFGNGNSVCGYNFDDPDYESSIEFLNTNNSVHEQPLFNLSAGEYDIYINCADIAGNKANETAEFSIIVDTYPPQLLQVYTSPGILHIEMDEASTCEYDVSSSFLYGSGIQMTGVMTTGHTASIEGDTFHIMCSDSFGNIGSYEVYL